MIISKLEMVVGTEYRQPSSKQNTVGKADAGLRFKEKLYNLERVNLKNSKFKDTKTSIFIDWVGTLAYYVEKVGKGSEWLDYILGRKETECEDLKFDIGFSTSESYTQAVDKGRAIKKPNDYIITVEKQIKDIKDLKIVKEVVEPTDEELISELKTIIKEEGLGIRVSKEDTYEDVLGKIADVRNK